MGALRVAVERRELANCDMEIFEVLRFRQAMNFVENLDAFNFDLTETLVHRVHAGVVDGCVVVTGADGAIDRHRGQAVATPLAYFVGAWTGPEAVATAPFLPPDAVQGICFRGSQYFCALLQISRNESPLPRCIRTSTVSLRLRLTDPDRSLRAAVRARQWCS